MLKGKQYMMQVKSIQSGCKISTAAISAPIFWKEAVDNTHVIFQNILCLQQRPNEINNFVPTIGGQDTCSEVITFNISTKI